MLEEVGVMFTPAFKYHGIEHSEGGKQYKKVKERQHA
jgi:hypothetical protein